MTNILYKFQCDQSRSTIQTLFTKESNQDYIELKKNSTKIVENTDDNTLLKICIIYFLDNNTCKVESGVGSRVVEVKDDETIKFIKGSKSCELPIVFLLTFVRIFPFYTMSQLIILSKYYIKYKNNESNHYKQLYANLIYSNKSLITKSSLHMKPNILLKELLTNTQNVKIENLDVLRYIYNRIMTQVYHLKNQSSSHIDLDTLSIKVFIIALLYSFPRLDLKIPGIYISFLPGKYVKVHKVPFSVNPYFPMINDFYGANYGRYALIKTKKGLLNFIHSNEDLDSILKVLASKSLASYDENMIKLIYQKFNISNFEESVYTSITTENNGKYNRKNTIIGKSINNIKSQSGMSDEHIDMINLFSFYLNHVDKTFQGIKNSIKKTPRYIIKKMIGDSINEDVSTRHILLKYKKDKLDRIEFIKDIKSVSLPYFTVNEISKYTSYISFKQLKILYRVLYRSDDVIREKLFYDPKVIQMALVYILLFIPNSTFDEAFKQSMGITTINIENPKKGISKTYYDMIFTIFRGIGIGMGVPDLGIISKIKPKTLEENIYTHIIHLLQYNREISGTCKYILTSCILKKYQTFLLESEQQKDTTASFKSLKRNMIYINRIIKSFVSQKQTQIICESSNNLSNNQI